MRGVRPGHLFACELHRVHELRCGGVPGYQWGFHLRGLRRRVLCGLKRGLSLLQLRRWHVLRGDCDFLRELCDRLGGSGG